MQNVAHWIHQWLEEFAAHFTPSSHLVSRTDLSRHSDSTPRESDALRKMKGDVSVYRLFCQSEILQILCNGCHVRSPYPSRMICQRPDCEINSTARLTEI